MLVLTRKLEEKIQIGNDIVITILKTKGKAVQIGVEAPRSVRVLRGELVNADEAAIEGSEPDDKAPMSGDRLRQIVQGQLVFNLRFFQFVLEPRGIKPHDRVTPLHISPLGKDFKDLGFIRGDDLPAAG